MSSSPMRMKSPLPLRKTERLRIGSSEASISSPRPSMNTAWPFWMASMMRCIQFLSPICSVTMPSFPATAAAAAAEPVEPAREASPAALASSPSAASPDAAAAFTRASSWFLSHMMPCSCGSMSSGQRVAFVTSAPFSMDLRSAGSDSVIHSAILESVVRMLSGSMLSVMGISRDFRSGSHMVCHSSRRRSAPNAPTYEMNAAESSTSPTRFAFFAESMSTSFSQRIFSDLSPPVSRSASDNRSMQSLACASTRAFSSVAARKDACSLFSRSSISRSASATTARSASAACLDLRASSSASMRGRTFL
mmetsp:Transcript_45988/g.143901  ORF Transcript_45988/g.143901 Transcript_45988/m.143901 type:complete len:307 (-) Transcript_45988:395-1315(-)